MALSCVTQEESNYLRATYLCYKIAPEAVRTHFDQVHPPSLLTIHLQNDKKGLQKLPKTVIKPFQLAQLYPSPGSPPSASSNYDITLLICLLRNMTPSVLPPPFGFDQLPDKSHTTYGAHLARIKFYRNKLAHSSEGKLSASEFTSLWNDVNNAIIGLGGAQFNKKLNDAKTIVLDSSFVDILRKLVSIENEYENVSTNVSKNTSDIYKLENDMIKTKYNLEVVNLRNTKISDNLSQIQASLNQKNELRKQHDEKMKELCEMMMNGYRFIDDRLRNIEEEISEAIPENRRVVPGPEDVTELIRILLNQWRTENKIFVSTNATNRVCSLIRENNCVTVIGNAGIGKTTAVRNAALELLQEGYNVVPVSTPDDIVNLYNLKQKTLFVIDDLCGKYTLNKQYLNDWKQRLNEISLLLESDHCKVMATCRLQVFNDERLKDLPIFLSKICDLNSKELSLSLEEKSKFVNAYCSDLGAEGIASLNIDFFPLLCSLCQKDKSKGVTFFKHPFQHYDKEIDHLLCEDKSGKYKYCCLSLVVMCNNRLKDDSLSNKIDCRFNKMIEDTLLECKLNKGTSPKLLLESLQTLVGTFLVHDEGYYRTVHDKLFDYLSYYFGKKMIHNLIIHADSEFISERFRWMTSGPTTDTEFTITIPDECVDNYIDRMIKDWSDGCVFLVFNNRNMKSFKFITRFLDHLNKLDHSDRSKLARMGPTEYDNNPLIQSCLFDDLNLMRWLINNGASVNQCDDTGMSIVYICCEEGNIDSVRELIKFGADLNKCDDIDISPLNVACRNGHITIVRELITHGADINKCSLNGYSPLNNACVNGHVDIVKELIKRGAYLNSCCDDECSPLNNVCVTGDLYIVRELIKGGASLNDCDDQGRSPLNNACVNEFEDIVMELLNSGANINCRDGKGNSPLNNACQNTNVNIVRELINGGADLNSECNEGYSPLINACIFGYIDIVRELIKCGADLNKCDHEYYSPLNHACRNGYVGIVRELIMCGANLNDSDKGLSPLNNACVNGHVDILRELIKCGADFRKCTETCIPPINDTCKCLNGYSKKVKELLKSETDLNKYDVSVLYDTCLEGDIDRLRRQIMIGVDINECDSQGVSPLNIACCKGHIDIIRELIKCGADLNKCSNMGVSPLFNASQNGHLDVVILLLEQCNLDNVNTSMHTGTSPLFVATVANNKEIVQKLLENNAEVEKCVHNKDMFCEAVNKYSLMTIDNYLKSFRDFINTHASLKVSEYLQESLGDQVLELVAGSSPLHIACLMGHVDIVKLFLEKNPNINITKEDGATPLFVARVFEHENIVKLLVEKGANG